LCDLHSAHANLTININLYTLQYKATRSVSSIDPSDPNDGGGVGDVHYGDATPVVGDLRKSRKTTDDGNNNGHGNGNGNNNNNNGGGGGGGGGGGDDGNVRMQMTGAKPRQLVYQDGDIVRHQQHAWLTSAMRSKLVAQLAIDCEFLVRLAGCK
jgi:hypothetical protein